MDGEDNSVEEGETAVVALEEEMVRSGIRGDWGGTGLRREGSRMSREKSDIQLCLGVRRRVCVGENSGIDTRRSASGQI